MELGLDMDDTLEAELIEDRLLIELEDSLLSEIVEGLDIDEWEIELEE